MTFDPGEWRPRYWTIACVSTFHLILAATLITVTPLPPEPTVFNAVDVVTFPDGTTSNPDPSTPAEPVTLDPPIALPKVRVDPRFGPKPTDMRTPPSPSVQALPDLPEPIAPTPVAPKPVASEPVAPAPVVPEPVVPKPVIPEPAPKPVPLTPAPQASPAPKAEAVPKLTPTPVPVPASTPVPELTPQPVTLRKNAPTPTLIQPAPTPLRIRADKLKVNQNPALKPLQTREIPLPALPTPDPVPAPGLPKQTATPAVARPSASPRAPVQSATPNVARTPSPPPPAYTEPTPAPAPSRIVRSAPTLPKVQVPRVRAFDLRLPEAPAATGASGGGAPSGTSAPSSGVTSLTPNRALPAGGGGGPQGGASGAQGGSGGSGGSAAGSGASGGGPAGPAAGGASGGGGGGGASGVLPRRPGGASVREAFPRSNGTLLGKMDTTFDCSRIGRDRDARCPEFTPMEGRNGRGAATYEVPVPKGVTPPRYANGTNPLPVCPPGTPGNQMGLSCLPSREGPGIPRP